MFTQYIKNREPFLCPAAPMRPSSYAMAGRWSGADLDDIDNGEGTVLLYDARRDGSPAFRHKDGLNAVFARGRPRWISRKDWQRRDMVAREPLRDAARDGP